MCRTSYVVVTVKTCSFNCDLKLLRFEQSMAKILTLSVVMVCSYIFYPGSSPSPADCNEEGQNGQVKSKYHMMAGERG